MMIRDGDSIVLDPAWKKHGCFGVLEKLPYEFGSAVFLTKTSAFVPTASPIETTHLTNFGCSTQRTSFLEIFETQIEHWPIIGTWRASCPSV